MLNSIQVFLLTVLIITFIESSYCQGLGPATKPDQQDLLPMFGTKILPYSTDDCDWPSTETTSSSFDFKCAGPFIPCGVDPECQKLGFNRTTLPCACSFSYCPDRLVYAPGAYKNGTGTPATDEQIAKAPHVVAPCNDCVRAATAPQHKQIGNCSMSQNCPSNGSK